MRLRKNDPTGSYWYMADGVSPASPVLTDAYTTFRPGISEISGAGSRFYLPDAQGNSRGLLDGSQGNTDGYNWDAFGNSVSRFGVNPTAFAWNVSSGYQSDGDSGLKLLGHRYYDSRTGRFISQDPAGDGDNWYAYADNDPTDENDPTGLSTPLYHNLGADFADGTGQMGLGSDFGFGYWQSGRDGLVPWMWSDTHHLTPDWANTAWGPWSDWHFVQEDSGFGMGGSAMFAGDVNERHRGESGAHYFFRGLWWAIKQFATLQPTPQEAEAWGKTSGIVRDAGRGKGNFGLGSATAKEAEAAGKAWVGDHYRVSSNGKAWVSQNGLRQYRPASFKPNLGRVQANLEQRYTNAGQWQSNGHIDIVP